MKPAILLRKEKEQYQKKKSISFRQPSANMKTILASSEIPRTWISLQEVEQNLSPCQRRNRNAQEEIKIIFRREVRY